MTASPCVIPSLTVFDATSLTSSIPAHPADLADCPLTWPTFLAPFATNQYAVPPVSSLRFAGLAALYSPGTTRFRVFTAAAADSSHVYVSMCDAGAIADINTTDIMPTTSAAAVLRPIP